MRVTMRSEFSGKFNTMDIPADESKLIRWLHATNRALVQDEFPELTDDQREFLKSGATPEEWEEYMGGNEE